MVLNVSRHKLLNVQSDQQCKTECVLVNLTRSAVKERGMGKPVFQAAKGAALLVINGMELYASLSLVLYAKLVM